MTYEKAIVDDPCVILSGDAIRGFQSASDFFQWAFFGSGTCGPDPVRDCAGARAAMSDQTMALDA